MPPEMPIDLLTLGAALVAGLLGGVHCLAMCGAIATGAAASARTGSSAAALAMALRLNLGRVGGYALAGAIAGGVGGAAVQWFRIDGLGLAMRVLAGAVLIVVALRVLDRRGRFGFLARPGQRLWHRLSPLTRPLLPADTPARQLALGALWGWLPCGLSTTMVLAAWFGADALNGALLMAAFGSGTLLAMVPLTWSGARAGQWLARPAPRAAAAGLLVAIGALTIAAPWLDTVPQLHAALSALGCRTALPG